MQAKDMKKSSSAPSREKMKSPDVTKQDGAPEREKSLFLTQIRFLDEQLESFQIRCDNLKEQKKDFILKTAALEKDMSDILEFLQHNLAMLEKDEEKLKEKVEKQRQSDQQKKDALEQLLNGEKQELQDQSDQLSSEKSDQAAKLEDQKVRLAYEEEQMLMRKSLDEQLKLLEDLHNIEVNKMFIDHRHIIDEKKQTVLNSIRQKVSGMIEEETTEHEKMRKEVEALSVNSLLLLWRKKKDRENLKRLCGIVIKMRVLNHKMIRKILNLRKESLKVKKRCKLLTGHIKELQSSTESLLDYKQAYRRCLALVSEERGQKMSDAAQLEERLQKERSGRKELEGNLKKAASFLTAVAMDATNIPGAQQKMQKLLQGMEVAELQEAESFPSQSLEQISEELKTQLLQMEAASSRNDEDPLFLMAKLRPGDLYLVPGPTWAPRAAPSSLRQEMRNRVKLPPIKKSLWQTALQEWMG